MCRSPLTTRSRIVCAVALVAVGAVANQLLVAAAQGPARSEDQLRRYLQDRVEVRKQIVDKYSKLKIRGGASSVEVLIATRDMLWAELATKTAKAERIALIERIVEHEKAIAAFYERTPDFQEVERLFLKIRLLDAQVTLEREKLGIPIGSG